MLHPVPQSQAGLAGLQLAQLSWHCQTVLVSLAGRLRY